MHIEAKHKAWSTSRLNAFEQCAKKYHGLYVVKSVKDEGNEYTQRGTDVHVVNGVPLPEKYKMYEPVLRKIIEAEGKLYTELQLAVNQQLRACEWFDKDTYVRGIIDVARLKNDVLWIGDYKTGKVKPANDQLMLFAGLGFIHWPKVQRIITSFIWLDGNTTTTERWTRQQQTEIWQCLLPRAKLIETALKTDSWPAKPSGLCRFCPMLKANKCEEGRRA